MVDQDAKQAQYNLLRQSLGPEVQISVGRKGKVVPLKDVGMTLPLDDHDVKQVVEAFKQEPIIKATLHEQSQEISR